MAALVKFAPKAENIHQAGICRRARSLRLDGRALFL
jgi:hypothetical protein